MAMDNAAMAPHKKRRSHAEMATVQREAKWAREPWLKRTVKKGLWALLVALGGCSLVPGYADYVKYGETAAKVGIEDVKHISDLEAQGFKAAAGRISLGAWSRLPYTDQRAFWMMVTGQDMGPPQPLPVPSTMP
jgi:hypothetical protein